MNFTYSIAAAAAVCASANAAVYTYTNLSAWQQAVDNPAIDLFPAGTSPSFITETFSGLTPGSSSGYSGGTGWNSWAAASSGGTVNANSSGLYSQPAGTSLLFTFGPPAAGEAGVLGIGGDFRFFNSDGVAQDGRIWVRLANGASIVKTFTAADSFVGFWTNDLAAPIAALRIQPVGASASTLFVGVDNLYFGTVPAPGAICLLGAAGLIGANRRRA
jgi:hypothetical protein